MVVTIVVHFRDDQSPEGDFFYGRRAIMLIKEFASKLELPKEAIQAIFSMKFTESEYRHYHTLFYQNREVFFKEIESKENGSQIFLTLYVHFFYERYCQMNQEDAVILMNGAKDLTLWANVCFHYYQVWGIQPYMWRFVDRIIDGTIVRIDCLEFEVKSVMEDIRCEEIFLLKERSLIINIHVPEQATLDIDRCKKAMDQAVRYFKHIPPIFYCDSWMLAPVLKTLLPQESKILQFQNLFNIIDKDEDNHLMEERIFDDILDDPKDYEEDTTLQRTAKAHLMKGGKLGTGIGIITSYYYRERYVSYIGNHKDMVE